MADTGALATQRPSKHTAHNDLHMGCQSVRYDAPRDETGGLDYPHILSQYLGADYTHKNNLDVLKQHRGSNGTTNSGGCQSNLKA